MINIIEYIILEHLKADSFLDKNNILYKKINGKWIGKPGIQVKPNGKGFQMKWKEDIDSIDIIYNNGSIV